MKAAKEYCPVCNSEMTIKKSYKDVSFRGIDVSYIDEAFVCPECGLETATIEQTANTQKAVSDAYRKKTGLLTGDDIRQNRQRLGLSQKALADRMTVGIASIKRWEGGIIQSRSMDKALRSVFWDSEIECNATGNRKFSIPRVKLAIDYLQSFVKAALLKKGDKMLYTTKYLWYADFAAFREIGKSMTGAAYANLPLGPQFNNYKELIDQIIPSDSSTAEPLSSEEKEILKRIAKAFPNPKKAFDASHREDITRQRPIGELIPYSDSARLSQF